MRPENIELRNKILQGVKLAFEELVITSAERNQNLVVADLQGNVREVPARDFLKALPQTEK